MGQRRSEDFVPPAAQRKAVTRLRGYAATRLRGYAARVEPRDRAAA